MNNVKTLDVELKYYVAVTDTRGLRAPKIYVFDSSHAADFYVRKCDYVRTRIVRVGRSEFPLVLGVIPYDDEHWGIDATAFEPDDPHQRVGTVVICSPDSENERIE